jgi:hypothetical protein
MKGATFMKSTFFFFTPLTVAFAIGACSSGPEGQPNPSESSAQQQSALVKISAHAFRGAVLPKLSVNPTFSNDTVPKNGDQNPYGVAFVPRGFPSGGLLHDDDVIVSNFNNAGSSDNGGNKQGTGTTIVLANGEMPPDVFFHDEKQPGFSTALGVLKRGFVILGTVPSADNSGTCNALQGENANVGPGALLVIDHRGKLVKTITDDTLLNGPWDLTIADHGDCARVFVSNVVTGTVTRLDLDVDARSVHVNGKTQIASGYMHQCDPNAFVLGPTGLALDEDRDILYVASTADNAIYAVRNASWTERDHGTGKIVVNDAVHLHGPLGLVRAANGDLISAQGDAVNPDPNQNSMVVEFKADGTFVHQIQVNMGSGGAFGVALDQANGELRFAAVDDVDNDVHIWVNR